MADTPAGGRLVLVGASPVVAGAGSARMRAALTAADAVVTAADDTDPAGVDALVDRARQGAVVAVLSEAGGPADPHRWVAAAHRAAVPVTVVPGASPVTAAVAVSGLPADRFRAVTAPPAEASRRRAWLAALATEPRTVVVLDRAGRLAGTLADLCRALGGDRPAALCVNPTEAGASAYRADLATLAEVVAAGGAAPGVGPGSGETRVAVVVAGSPVAADPEVDPARLRVEVAERMAGGESHRDAVAAVAAAYGLRRRAVYEATVDV